MREEVWVWLPREREGGLHAAAEELCHEAHGLCRRLGVPMVGQCDVEPAGPALERLRAWGMERVNRAGPELPPHPLVPGGHAPFAALATDGPPRAFLFAADTFGKVAAPLWAAETGALLVTGATGLTASGAAYVVSRPSHGERFEALVTVPLDTPLVVTLVPGAVGSVSPPANDLPAPAAAREGAAPPDGEGAAYRIFPPDPENLDIADAERIVAFGRGAFNTEAVALVERLAQRLGAVVAGTRPAADEGWLPFARQVGLTGAIVHPRLYVAVGISGAPYHMVGVKEPQHLIAINSDPEAPIFGSAQLGIVGDLYDVLPRLLADLEAGKGLPGAVDGGGRP